MSSSARWPSGSTRRWAGSGGRLHRRPEGAASGAAGDRLRALGVSQAWFYKWRDGDASPQHARRGALAAEIKRLFAKHHGRYGSPRITADLRQAGWRGSEENPPAILRAPPPPPPAQKRRKQNTPP